MDKWRIGIWCICLWSLWSCDSVKPEKDIPAYIYLEGVDLSTTLTREGAASSNISEVWLTVDGVFLGAYPIPGLIPILAEGSTEVQLRAGIRENGVSTLPQIYPFYDAFTQVIDLQPLQTDTVRPVFRYRQDARFGFIERFEGEGHIFQVQYSGTDANKLNISTESAYEGRGAGLIQLDTANYFTEIASSQRFSDLLESGANVYLEVDYRSEAPVSFGVVTFPDRNGNPEEILYEAGFRPADQWSKIYFNLTPVIFSSGADAFQIILRTALPTEANGTFTTNNANVWLDNVKLVYFGQ